MNGSPEKPKDARQAAAEKIRALRRQERSGSFFYMNDRGRDEYLQGLKGVKHLFNYVSQLTKPAVLDIGAGTTRGINEIAKSDLGENLSFEATVLTATPDIEKNLGNDHVHITSAEALRGISPESYGCALAVVSIAYSSDPESVIKNIDRVLIPGGVLKAMFQTDPPKSDEPAREHKSAKEFAEMLTNLEYDVCTRDDEKTGSTVLLAVKPGHPEAPSAQQLLNTDFDEYSKQQKYR